MFGIGIATAEKEMNEESVIDWIMSRNFGSVVEQLTPCPVLSTAEQDIGKRPPVEIEHPIRCLVSALKRAPAMLPLAVRVPPTDVIETSGRKFSPAQIPVLCESSVSPRTAALITFFI